MPEDRPYNFDQVRDTFAATQAMIDQARAELKANLDTLSDDQVRVIQTYLDNRQSRLDQAKSIVDEYDPVK